MRRLNIKSAAESVAQWEREMSAREILVAEAFTGSDLTRLVYERRCLSPFWTRRSC
jgi:hypothetical protein